MLRQARSITAKGLKLLIDFHPVVLAETAYPFTTADADDEPNVISGTSLGDGWDNMAIFHSSGHVNPYVRWKP